MSELLTILIPTVVGREEQLYRLNERLITQICGEDSFMKQFAKSHAKLNCIGTIIFGHIEICDYYDNKMNNLVIKIYY